MSRNVRLGPSRSSDIVPNGEIVPLASISVPGSITLSTYATYGTPMILNLIGTGTFSISTAHTSASFTTGVGHAAATEMYLPVNGQDKIYFSGSGTLSCTLYTSKDQDRD